MLSLSGQALSRTWQVYCPLPVVSRPLSKEHRAQGMEYRVRSKNSGEGQSRAFKDFNGFNDLNDLTDLSNGPRTTNN
jgi:hypothetical protein